MARRRRRRKNTGDQIVLSLILVALVWAFAPGVGWDLLDLRSRLGWPPLRSGQALSSLPDSEAAQQLRELTVIKRNGRRVPFDRDKLVRSLQISLRKRPVESERVEKMVSTIVRELESGGEAEVSSEAIGEIVMEALSRIDNVAYVRFASVYKNFQDADDFDKFVSELRPGAATD